MSPPKPENEIRGSWYGVIYEKGRKKILFVAKVINRFLHDENGPVDKLRMRCLKPKYGSGNLLQDTPWHLPDDVDDFSLTDVISGPLIVTPKGSENFEVKDYDKAIELFNQATKIDRKSFL